MSSILIYGGNSQSKEGRLADFLTGLGLEISENNADLIFIEPEEDKKSIGIEQIRDGMKFLNQRPLNHKVKAVVVKRAEILTEQAQTAMLKALEEHEPYANIILCAKTQNDLIPTVISRCRRIEVKTGVVEKSDWPSLINDILSLDLGGRLAWAAENIPENKEGLIDLLDEWVGELRSDLSLQNVRGIETITAVKHDLENTNVSTKLALENLLLRL